MKLFIFAGIKIEMGTDKRTEKTPRAGKKLCFFYLQATLRPCTSKQEKVPFFERERCVFVLLGSKKNTCGHPVKGLHQDLYYVLFTNSFIHWIRKKWGGAPGFNGPKPFASSLDHAYLRYPICRYIVGSLSSRYKKWICTFFEPRENNTYTRHFACTLLGGSVLHENGFIHFLWKFTCMYIFY